MNNRQTLNSVKSNSYQLGVVGLGGATTQMLPSLASHPYFRIAAGADPRREARERFASDFGVPTFAAAEKLCESKEIDVVYIGAPHEWHMPIAIIAAERGKHVIVEKPMAIRLAECDGMIEAARRNNVHIVVGHTHGFNAPILKAREIVGSGELGALKMINTWNYNDYLYRPRWPAELRTELGGGIIHNQVPHQVDIVRLLGGGLVRSVRAMAWAHDPARPTEGSHLSFLQFEDGSAASIVFSGYDFFDTDEFENWVGELGEDKIAGRHGRTRQDLLKLGGAEAEVALKSSLAYGANVQSDAFPAINKHASHHPHFGIVIVSCTEGDIRPSTRGVTIYGKNGRVDVPVRSPRAFPDKSGALDELHAALTRDVKPIHSGEWGKATLEVCLAILTSARERREVKLSHQVAVNGV